MSLDSWTIPEFIMASFCAILFSIPFIILFTVFLVYLCKNGNYKDGIFTKDLTSRIRKPFYRDQDSDDVSETASYVTRNEWTVDMIIERNINGMGMHIPHHEETEDERREKLFRLKNDNV